MATKIIIVVEGGLVTDCFSDDPELEVIMVDKDNEEFSEDAGETDLEEKAFAENPDCVHEVY